MALQKLPVTNLNDENHRRRHREITNLVLSHQHDDSRVQTPAEKLAGVTPVNYAYPPGHVWRYDARGDGTTDDYFSFSQALLVSGSHEVIIPYTSAGYLIGTPLSAPANCAIRGIGKPQLFSTTNGEDILFATSTATFSLRGVRFLGASASATPINGYVYGTGATGLVTCTSVTDVLIEDCEFDRFYNGVCALGCARVWINKNRSRRFYFMGICTSLSSQFSVERNVITECQQTGAAVAYGVQATGDQAGGSTQTINSISFNQINGVPSWDGIMSHDVTGLHIIGNDIRDVRKGIDIGHLTADNVVNDVVISGNIIQSTDTDTYSGAAAECGGIFVAGYDTSNTVNNVTITGNIIREFFRVSGMVGAGAPSNITISNATHVSVTGNSIAAAGDEVSNAGVNIVNHVDSLSVCGNNMEGTMARGGIRFESVTSDVCTLSGNTIEQTNTADGAIVITGSTLSAFNNLANATNSTLPFSASTSTITYATATSTGSYTGTLTQCTTAPTGTVDYSVNGDLVTLRIPLITATSANVNQSLVTGMPAEIRPSVQQHCIGVTQDNGLNGISKIRVDTNGDLALFVGTSTVFTAANTKGVGNSTITYRRS